MTTRSTMKSYCKVIQCAMSTSASVDFKDSVGNSITCNYFSVDCRSGDAGANDTGFFLVQPSGVYDSQASTIEIINDASGTTSHTGSGTGGVMGTADRSVEMSLNTMDKATGVLIWNKLAGTGAAGAITTATFIVTYGNRKQANPNRDQDDTYYPPGN